MSYAWRLVLLVVAYYGAAWLGLQYASIGRSISLVWPPTGVAFAALLLLGYRYWPGVTLGAFLANASTAVPLAAAAGIAVGNTLEALAATYLLRRAVGPRPRLDDLRHVRALVLFATPLAAMLSAAIGVTSLSLAGALGRRLEPTAFAIWWMGDLLGALVVAPVFLTGVLRSRQQSARGILETVVLCLGTVLALELGLGQIVSAPTVRQVEYPYLLFPFVIWAAVRFGAHGAALMTFTVAVVAVWHTVQGGGPFVSPSVTGTLFGVTCYLLVVSVTGLVLAAAVSWERDQASAALQRSQERLQLALDAARMGSWFWSVRDDTLTWDDNLRELFGVRPGEQVTRYEDFLARVHPEDRPSVAESVRRAVEQGEQFDCEFRIVLPDGSIRWIADHGRFTRDVAGGSEYMTGLCTDVSDRKLAEERLQHADRMESVGRLAGGVAHETNNQMSVVLGAASFILKRPDLPQVVRSDVEYIREAAERTAAITAQLLAFSRRQLLRPEVLDLNAVVSGWEPIIRRVMGEDCEVTIKTAPPLGPVKADPGQLQQVLLNLALNARDAMPQGGHLTVETFQVELGEGSRRWPGVALRPGLYAVLAVSDTGQGMDAATLSHLFEPFFTTKEPGKGTGLGLATVYGIVKQSGGYVWAYSEPGQGTTIKVYLPLISPPAEPAASSPTRISPAAGRELVLVVEDEALVRYMARRALEDAGYRVLEADNGPSALDLVTASPEPVSLFMIDVVLPGMSGRQVADRLRTRVPGTPVLFVSGYTDGEILRRGLLEPGAAFLQKPFTPELLVGMVHQLLHSTSSTHPDALPQARASF